MALEIVWSKRASKKFDQILDYLSTEWGNQVTKAFVRSTYDFLDILCEFPSVGTIENKEKGIRGFVIIEQISVFYSIQVNRIIILSFFDNRQNPRKKRF